MNYELLYDKIIAKAKTELRKKAKGIYFESHHIIPRCMGGDDKKTNLVLLTAKEHFLCHKILCEIYPLKQGIKFAFWRMVTKKEKGTRQKTYKIGCREYERIKKEIAFIQSERKKGKPFTDIHKQNISKNKKGKKSPGSGIYLRTKSRKGYKLSQETRTKMSNSRKGKPSGTLGKPAWNKGIATGKLSEEAKSKIREARNGRPAWNKGLKTGPSKKRGIKLSEEVKAKISNSKKKKAQEIINNK